MAARRGMTVLDTFQSLPAKASAQLLPQTPTSIVPSDSIAGRALISVIAIMTFLAALTVGGVALVHGAAGEWQSQIAREMTIQLLPAQGRDLDADVKKAADIAAAAQGVAGVRVYSKAESERLLEPWLGTGLSFDDMPVPRLVVVRVSANVMPDVNALRSTLAAQIANARLDDHRGWIDRMGTMADAAIAGGVFVLALVLAVTTLSVMFATRGAMAANRPIIEVLHFVGAKDRFIAVQFQRHFLWLGFKGGAIGGGSAILAFAVAGFVGDWFKGTPSEDQLSALFGSFAVGLSGYAASLGLIVLIAGVTAGTSRLTVYHTLGAIE